MLISGRILLWLYKSHYDDDNHYDDNDYYKKVLMYICYGYINLIMMMIIIMMIMIIIKKVLMYI